MKTRSAFEICLPLALFACACVISIPTLILAVAWMSVGVVLLGYRSLEDFPCDRMPRAWRHGLRGACLLFYHLAWWPWYARHELRDAARRARRRLIGGQAANDTDVSSASPDGSKEE